METLMSASDVDLGELAELLGRFEPGGDCEKFRHTAIYNSLKFNYELLLHAELEGRRTFQAEVVSV